MVADYTFRQGDTEPVWADALAYSDGSPVNLRSATVTLIVRALADTAPLALTGPVTVTDPPEGGLVQWRPSVEDSATSPGAYLANWMVVFSDGTPMSFPTSGFLFMLVEESLTADELTVGARPSVAEVASLLRARTKILGGGEAGTFNDKTRPTAPEVESLIDDAEDEVGGKAQPPTVAGSKYERRFRGAVRLYAATLVELSYFPEQVRANHSPAAVYQQLYASRIKALIAEGEVGRPGGMGDGTGGGDAPADAAWTFPDAAPGALVGWRSRW